MKKKTYQVERMSHVEGLRDRLLETYSRVEVLGCVRLALGVIVTMAVGY